MRGEALPGSRPSVVTVGTFDGLHLGHQRVLQEVILRARAAERLSVAVTFEPHPLKIVAPERAPCRLTTSTERRELWPFFGLDYVVVLGFTPELRHMPPENFVRRILVEGLRVGELVIGHDHGFGKDRRGDVDLLRRLGREEGFQVDVVGPVADERGIVSSSRIREAIAAGDFTAAAAGLGRPYSVLGRIEAGAGRGRSLGFPTANIDPVQEEKCLPPEGVYAVRVETRGASLAGMANLGPRPTFDEFEPRLEVHLVDWDGGVMKDEWARVEFVAWLRPVRRFPDPAALAAQLAEDREAARRALSADTLGGAAGDGWPHGPR